MMKEEPIDDDFDIDETKTTEDNPEGEEQSSQNSSQETDKSSRETDKSGSEEKSIAPEEDEQDMLTRNGPPSEEFLQLFKSIPTKETDEEKMDYICRLAYTQYVDATKQVVLEGSQKAWIACAIYLAMIKKKASAENIYAFSLVNIQKHSGVSILELFDKLERYSDIIDSSKRVKEHIQKIQGSLAVAAVVYKKFLPVYRGLFLETNSGEGPVSSYELLKIIWNVFCYLKKHQKQEDLLSCYNLLLCVIEMFYYEICKLEREDLVNPDFSEKLVENDYGILEFLCRCYQGSVIDAKHFKQHWFVDKGQSLLNFQGSEFFSNHNSYIFHREQWNEAYEELLLIRGEMDERLFVPEESHFHQVFDEIYDSSAVELLRRGPDSSTFADVELLLRMSTQSCLEKLIETKKNGSSSKTYILSSDNLFPTTPFGSTTKDPSKLISLIPEGWQVESSQLNILCNEMKDNPMETIVYFAELFTEKLVEQINAEIKEFGPEYDSEINDCVPEVRDITRDLFYTILERIVKAERDKKQDRESDLSHVYKKEEFLASIYCCAIELLLYNYSSRRIFPWSLNVLNLESICFQKVIQLVIRSLPELGREMVKHLNKKEEEILEELGWSVNSPIWIVIERNPGCIPSCDSAWKAPKMLAERYSPTKKMKLDDGRESPIKPAAGSMTMVQFIGKVYYLSCNRLNDLCDRMKITEFGKRMCWTLFDYLLRNEAHLMMNRHLDQNLLCIVYIVAKYLVITCTFMDLISHYRHQPQAQSYIYREVHVDSSVLGTSPSEDGNSRDSTSYPLKLRCGSTIPTSQNSVPGTPEPQNCEKVDLIMYYNRVFLPRVEEFVKAMEAQQEKLLIMPKSTNFGMTPLKRTLGGALGERFQVYVTPLNSPTSTQERRLKYGIHQSPRKDLQAINQMVNPHNPAYFAVPEEHKLYTYRR